MANVYATKNGVWSDVTVWNTGALPTVADNVYANGYSVDIDMNVDVLSIRNEAKAPAVAGGGFTLADTLTVTATNGFIAGSSTVVTFTGGDLITATINGDVFGSITTNGVICIRKNGIGTLNINGNILPRSSENRHGVVVSASGITNIVGDIRGVWSSSRGLIIDGANAEVNILGNLNPEKSLSASQNEVAIVVSVTCVINLTGNIYGGNGNSTQISLPSTAQLYVTGNVFGGTGTNIALINFGYLNIVGIINSSHTAGNEATAVASSSSAAINLFSGPFICGEYGAFPFQVKRVHLIRTMGTYVEFRDETTDGALSPGAIAPAARLVSPDTVVDAPIPSDVRFGVKYAQESQTGTAHIPPKEAVAVGVPVDDSVGEATLRPEDVWNFLRANADVPGSFGAWLKNAATIQTTGGQLAALISNNEEE